MLTCREVAVPDGGLVVTVALTVAAPPEFGT
jgi:hypothetical protein